MYEFVVVMTGIQVQDLFSDKACIVKINCFFTAAWLYETEMSMIGKDVLQSTVSDGKCFRQDLDFSVIKGKFW